MYGLLFVLLVVQFHQCIADPPLTCEKADNCELLEEVLDKRDDIIKLFQQADNNAAKFEELMLCYTENVVVMPPGETIIENRTELREWFEQIDIPMKDLKMIARSPEARVDFSSNGDIATMVVESVVSAGTPPIPAKVITIWKKIAGTWLLHVNGWYS